MTRIQRSRLAAWTTAVLAAVTLAAGAAAEAIKTTLASGSVLELSIPSDWRLQENSNALVFRARLLGNASPEDSRFWITAFELAPESPVRTTEHVRKLVEVHANASLPWTTQERLEVKRISLQEGVAFYYHSSDRNSTDLAEDFREAHTGAAVLSGHFVMFVVLTHSGDTEFVEKALEVVRSMRLEPSD